MWESLSEYTHKQLYKITRFWKLILLNSQNCGQSKLILHPHYSKPNWICWLGVDSIPNFLIMITSLLQAWFSIGTQNYIYLRHLTISSKLPSVVVIFGLAQLLSNVEANPDAKMLYNDLLRKSGYNKLIRPVTNNSDVLTVKVGLKLSQLIDVVSSPVPVYSNTKLYKKIGMRFPCLLLSYFMYM